MPIEHTRRLYDAIVAPKTLVEVEADHNDEGLLAGETIIQSIVRFIERLLERAFM